MPQDVPSMPDSALGLTNIHRAAGLEDRARKRVWETTRRAIERCELELQGELPTGGTSVVFEVREKVAGRLAGRRLVVKVIVDPENSHALACFRREVKVLASEHVPTDVVPALKHYQDVDDSTAPNTQPFLVMERIDGRPILNYVRDPRPLPMTERIALIERVFLALDRLHSCNLLHGDGSPNNVLIQKGDVVRLIDLGRAKPIRGVGTRSYSEAGGTGGYQAESVLRGEERLAAWADLHSFAAVAFHTLTDRPPGKGLEDVADNKASLAAAGVPPDVSKVLLKALREKDPRKETDPNLYATAADLARDLHACRKRQERRVARERQAKVALLISLLVTLPILSLAWVGWSKYWSEIRADSTKQIVTLRDQASQLADANHPRVKELTAKVDRLTREREDALARGQTDRADAVAPELIATLRQAIALKLGLERCLPLRQALGEVLTRTPWVDDADLISQERKALEQRYTEIGEKIDRGEADAAWIDLGTLNAALADLARRNVLAARVVESRLKLNRIRESLSGKLRERGAGDPDFMRLSKDADSAEQAWKAGDWTNAERLFGLAHQALDTWLAGKETPEELATRREAERAAAVAAAKRERTLLAEIARLEGTEKELNGQVRGLQAQVARLADQNLRDHDAYERASKDLQTERSRAEAERNQSRQKFTSLSQDLAAKEESLRAALADLEIFGIRPVKGWSGTKAGDLKVVRLGDQELRFRWCPGGSLKMGSPKNESSGARGDDEDQVDVTISHGFWMLETEVTQGLWVAVMASKPDWSVAGEGVGFPAYNLSHDEAETFAAKLTGMLRQSKALPTEWRVVLPSEAQWEHAARAGSPGPFPFDADDATLSEYAWYSGNSKEKVHRVKLLQPNRWGLHDMSGNLWEWTADGYTKRLPGGIDPRGPSRASTWAVRGGSWANDRASCRSANRNPQAPEASIGIGFRIAATQD